MSQAADTPEALRAKLTREWDIRGIDVATLRIDRRGTIVPMQVAQARVDVRRVTGLDDGVPSTSAVRSVTAAGLYAEDEPTRQQSRPPPEPRGTGATGLPTFSAEHLDASIADVELTETIGEGGMGIVWAARQVPLRREVAVKSVHPQAPLEETTRALLREARVTGALEHPNVVPIHALGRDEKGRPLIVMKRIEGTSWAELLEEQRRQGPGAVMTALEHHLKILIDVAKAVHFAHCRGIVHRDVKPDNVMIGSFGEVYVVDWGIAVSLRENQDLDVPLARDVDEITGSPAYMAPEMAVGDGPRIDGRTDVYLLGATLHEILTGDPPHCATSTVAMLSNAFASPPHAYGPEIPADLASICHCAMARMPADRFQTAAAFAAALQRFLAHRDSTMLAEEASKKLEELRELITIKSDPEQGQRIYAAFNQCRFGFEHALKIWKDNPGARDELQAALEAMIEYELERGSPGAAEALFAELPIAMPRLARRIESHRADERQTRHELDELKQQLDPTLTDRPRAFLAFAVALTWPALHAFFYWVQSATEYAVGHRELTVGYAFYLVASLAVGIAQRETLFARAASGAQTQLTHTLAYLAFAALWPVAERAGVDIPGTFTIMFFVGSVLFLVAALAIDRRFLAWGVSMLTGLVLALIMPSRALLWMGGAGFVGSFALGLLRLRTKSPTDSLPLSAQWSRAQTEAFASRRHDD
jgi:eukaryotic-like serine/threonine-protein kinase